VARAPESGPIEATEGGAARRNAETPEPAVPPNFLMSAADLAKHLGQPVERVEVALRRHRQNHRDCVVETSNPRVREPRYLYRVRDVWPVLVGKLPGWLKRATTDD
jgi:hypothetical protein